MFSSEQKESLSRHRKVDVRGTTKGSTFSSPGRSTSRGTSTRKAQALPSPKQISTFSQHTKLQSQTRNSKSIGGTQICTGTVLMNGQSRNNSTFPQVNFKFNVSHNNGSPGRYSSSRVEQGARKWRFVSKICFDIFILIRCPVRKNGIIEPNLKVQFQIIERLLVKSRLKPIERAESD